MGILREGEIRFSCGFLEGKMCNRCLELVSDGMNLDVSPKGARRGCRCKEGCDRLIEGPCVDCGHYVRHP